MKKVIITWCSSGLGYELCKQYLEMGYAVVGLSRSMPNLPIEHITLDLTQEDSIVEVSNKIVSDHSNFDIFINCAWIWDIQPMWEMSIDSIQSMMQVNLLWTMSLYAKLRNLIIINNVDICFVWATIWYKANEYMPAYSVSKRWLRWFIENVRHDLKATNARVIGVHPWWLDTESNIWPQGRESIIKWFGNTTTMLSTNSVAQYIIYTLNLPKNMEVSESIINRK
jgi:short-subunit dehydrogenase